SRRSILTAARELMDATGGIAFTVDELAERADVSRRTVFNHFASLDDVVAEVATEILGELADNLAAPATRSGRRGTALDELIGTVRGTDIVGPMAYLTRILGPVEPTAPWKADLLARAVSQLGSALVDILAQHHPD